MVSKLPIVPSIILDAAGTPQDITNDVRVNPAVTVSRAVRSETDYAMDTGSSSFEVENKTGAYSVLNPASTLYGEIGRNTPVTVGYTEGDSYLSITNDTAFSYSFTTSGTNVSGDLDARVDARLDNWLSPSPYDTVILAGKYDTTSNQRSWFLATRSRKLYLEWSADGSTIRSATSTVDLPVKASRRLAVRAVLDIDNGASGCTVTFYTCPTGYPSSSSGWVQLGDPVTASGTTSVFASTALLQVGHGTNLGYVSGHGQYYRFAMYDGTTVARDVSFTGRGKLAAPTTFTDAAGATWAFFNGATTEIRKQRIAGEVASWPASRDLSGKDATVGLDIGGILRRLGKNTDPVASVMRREMTSASTALPVAYWPMEDGDKATQAAAVIGTPMQFNGTPDMAAFSGFDCSDPIPQLTDGGSFTGTVPSHTTTGSYQVRCLMHPDNTAAANNTLVRIYTTGTVRHWDLRYLYPNTWTMYAFDADDNLLSSFATASPITAHQNQLRTSIELKQNGANVDYQMVQMEVGGTVAQVGPNSTVTSATLGRITSVNLGLGQTNLTGTAVGHLAVYTTITSIFDLASQFNAWIGETAGARIKRLCAENSVPFSSPWDDLFTYTQPLGGQRSDTLPNLLEEAASAGQGLLTENRHEASLCFIPPGVLSGQTPAVTLDFAAGHIAEPLEPVTDDKMTVNAFTASRRSGGDYLSEVTSGRLSTQAPPNGVGRTSGSDTFNLRYDDQAAQIASWRTHLGTYEGTRYTQITLNLANSATNALIDDLLRLDIGHMVRLVNLPAEHGPDAVDVLVWGTADSSGSDAWTLTLVCVPAEPWNTAVADDGVARADTDGSQLNAAMTSTQTDADVLSTGIAPWIDSGTYAGDFPFDIRVAGEVMTVTAVTGVVSDSFQRIVTSGWGTADTGESWTTTGGSSSDYSVQGA